MSANSLPPCVALDCLLLTTLARGRFWWSLLDLTWFSLWFAWGAFRWPSLVSWAGSSVSRVWPSFRPFLVCSIHLARRPTGAASIPRHSHIASISFPGGIAFIFHLYLVFFRLRRRRLLQFGVCSSFPSSVSSCPCSFSSFPFGEPLDFQALYCFLALLFVSVMYQFKVFPRLPCRSPFFWLPLLFSWWY